MAIARVQYKTGFSSSGTSLTITLDAAPAAGDLLIFGIATSGSAIDRVSVMSQTGVTWARIKQESYSGITVEQWAGIVGSGASAVLHVTLAQSLQVAAVVAEYSGLGTRYDRRASNFGDHELNPAADSGTTATTAYADELCVATLGTNRGFGAAFDAPSNSFTEVAEAASSNIRVAFEEYIATATLAADTNASLSPVPLSGTWAGCIATYPKASGGGHGPPIGGGGGIIIGGGGDDGGGDDGGGGTSTPNTLADEGILIRRRPPISFDDMHQGGICPLCTKWASARDMVVVDGRRVCRWHKIKPIYAKILKFKRMQGH